MSVLEALYSPSEAVTLTAVLLATELVTCGKLALCVCAGTNTGFGVMAGLLLERLTVSPAVGESPSK